MARDGAQRPTRTQRRPVSYADTAAPSVRSGRRSGIPATGPPPTAAATAGTAQWRARRWARRSGGRGAAASAAQRRARRGERGIFPPEGGRPGGGEGGGVWHLYRHPSCRPPHAAPQTRPSPHPRPCRRAPTRQTAGCAPHRPLPLQLARGHQTALLLPPSPLSRGAPPASCHTGLITRVAARRRHRHGPDPVGRVGCRPLAGRDLWRSPRRPWRRRPRRPPCA